MGPIPEEFLDSVRSGVDIVDLVSDYVSLKKTGQNYMGLCPFHREKTPSFSVSPAKQIFYCFGCGTGGNVLSFLMKIENIPFVEAVEVLAERLGMELPRSPGLKEKYRNKEKVYDLNAHTAEYYHRVLVKSEDAKAAREYLSGRGVEKGAWERFLLGFAPKSGGLLRHLRGKGYSPQEIQQSGVFSERYGNLQERFRGRIIFPIYDARGRCLGFGGRTLGEGEPKYLNSPESKVFNKSRNLYGLHLAIPTVREEKRIMVVEGYLDCITAHQYGFQNTVAALGTAFTRDQSRLISRYTKDVVLAFDEDAAGSAAAMRGAGLLQENGARVSILRLPEGKDPDDFLRAHGRETFEAQLREHTLGYLEFKLEKLLYQYNPGDVVERVEIVGQIVAELAQISNHVLREGFIQMAAHKMQTSEEAVRLELSRYLKKQSRLEDKTDKNRYNMEQGKKTLQKRCISASELARQGLFRFMCQDRTLLERVREELGEEIVFTEKLKGYRELFEQDGWSTPAELIQMTADKQGELAGLLMDEDELVLNKPQSDRLIDDYIWTLKKEQLSQIIDAKQVSLRKCEKTGDQEGIKGLLAEIHLLYEELEHLKNSNKDIT